jgi:hypothetical protein
MIRQNGSNLQKNIEIEQADKEQDELDANQICGSTSGNCIVYTRETDCEIGSMFETPEWPR